MTTKLDELTISIQQSEQMTMKKTTNDRPFISCARLQAIVRGLKLEGGWMDTVVDTSPSQRT